MSSLEDYHCVKLNTGGCCLICLERVFIKSEVVDGEESADIPIRFSSISLLFNYLKLNFKDVASLAEVDGKELDIHQRSVVLALLCERCSEINEKVSELVRVLEVAQMKINCHLEFIRNKISEGGGTEASFITYQSGTTTENQTLEEVEADAVESLRRKLSKQCSEALKSQPKVKIRRTWIPSSSSSESQASFDAKQQFNPKIDNRTETHQKDISSDPIQVAQSQNSNEKRLEANTNLNGSSGKPFSDPYILQKHKQQVHQAQDFHCELCQATFHYRPDAFKRHVEKCSNITRRATCKLCQRKFTTNYLMERHQQEVHFKTTRSTCDTCGKVFASGKTLRDHKKYVHLGVRFSCTVPGCQKLFLRMSLMRQHLKRDHRIESPRNSEETVSKLKKIVIKVEADNEDQLASTSQKGYHDTTPVLKRPEQSPISDTSQKIDAEGFTISTGFLPTPKVDKNASEGASPKRIKLSAFRCQFCQMAFQNRIALRNHFQKKHNTANGLIPPEKCRRCNRTFVANSKSFLAHQKTCTAQPQSVVSGTKKFECPTCGKKFCRLSHLKAHVRSVHESVRNYQCDYCQYKFFRRADLTRHRDSVHLHKKFHCDFPGCEKTYSCSNRLKIHRITYHPEVDEEDKEHTLEGFTGFECELCKKVFESNFALRIHHGIIHKNLSVQNTALEPTVQEEVLEEKYPEEFILPY